MTHEETQKAFRTAFDYLARQTVKIGAYPGQAEYFLQAADEYCRLGQNASELGRQLLIDCYEELERRWKAAHDTGRADQGEGDHSDAAGAVRNKAEPQ